MNVLIGYGYHPTTAATYMQRALERRVRTTFVGTSYGDRPGYTSGSDVSRIAQELPDKPDLFLYVDSGAAWYFPRGLTHMDCATACYLIDVHVGSAVRLKQAMFFDYVFTAQRDFVDVLRHAGHPHVYWLPLACAPDIHVKHEVQKRFDIGFVGATGGQYARRTRLLERLGRRYSVNDYHRSYTPAEMARAYSESRIVFNCSLRDEVNMRLFEGLATGSLMLTDRIGNGLSQLVTDREHVLMYDDDQLLDIVDELLRDPVQRDRVARQGYEHVRAHHTYAQRVDTLLNTVCAPTHPLRKDAPLRGRKDADVQLAYADIFSRGGEVTDSVDQLTHIPLHWRYQLPAATYLTLGLLRRVRRAYLKRA